MRCKFDLTTKKCLKNYSIVAYCVDIIYAVIANSYGVEYMHLYLNENPYGAHKVACICFMWIKK